MAAPIDVNSVPDSVLLPMAVIRPGMLDWVRRGRLTEAQQKLLQMYEALTPSRKAQILGIRSPIETVTPAESIPAYKIKPLYEEQMRENARTPSSGALTDTTKSEIA